MKDPISKFIENERDIIISDQLYEEFDTLAVIYGKPCSFYKTKDDDNSEEDEEDEEDEGEEEEEEEQTKKSFVVSDYLAKKSDFSLDPATFEQHWQQWNISIQKDINITS
eukprot:CAMPEP_0206158932 /NCGR_PEP_ID=MMETSP1474-20131121/5299_1 /ASSEMBLY_ACC=CAM_ASM_001110 /TAXON_ID=97495 /ORGANISM="Imantonia sp., Strain RCC918" /LENGTH=109 /DNA_ID=CAMNT_0053559277 /DNA_START=647 /DNA_END=973 /DNA_ORIENTATION=+